MAIARLEKIISGGQTGGDRAALDGAINHGIPHGSWCPKGRRPEDGIIFERYCLKETPQSQYRQHTQWNVRDADATLILTLRGQLTGGALFIRQCAERISCQWVESQHYTVKACMRKPLVETIVTNNALYEAMRES